MLTIKPVTEKEELPVVKELFSEYARSMHFNLCFQNFDEELKKLPGKYAPPDGCLLIAIYKGEVAGCVALRKLEPEICEMKRLYVRPPFRGLSIGKTLARKIIDKARKIGYKRMRLDTVSSMQTAQKLYEAFGFTDIPPYCINPIPGVRHMERFLI